MADTDPKHEVGDVERPHLRRSDTREAEADPDLIAPREDTPGKDQRDHHHPEKVRVAGGDERAVDVTIDVSPGGGRGPVLAHARCPLSCAPASEPRTTFFRYVTPGRVPTSSRT